jgi:hypothetical protein
MLKKATHAIVHVRRGIPDDNGGPRRAAANSSASVRISMSSSGIE